MTSLPRLLSPVPEAQRELFALPRWWIMLFTLLATAPFASMLVLQNPAVNGGGQESLAYLFPLLVLGMWLAALTIGAVHGWRAQTRASWSLPCS